MSAPLPLQDIHLPPPPGVWPPAPGWWLLALVLAASVGFAALQWRRYWRRRRLRRARERLFDATLQAATEPAARLAALSQLLRRAARSGAMPASATLAGDDWLRFLDGDDAAYPFSGGAGRLLLEGPFRAPATHTDDASIALAALEALARQRYLQLLEAGDA